MHRFQFPASNRNQNCEITPLHTLLSLHSLIKNKKKERKQHGASIYLKHYSVE